MTERVYIIPLRKDFIKVARYKRAKKTVSTVRKFLSKHLKSDDIRLGNMLNRMLWKRGIKNPPGKIKVVANKDEKGIVKAELFGHKYIEKKKIEKVEKSKLEQLKEKMLGKEQEKKEEHNKEAITHVPEEDKTRGNTQIEKKDIENAEAEKTRKTSSGKAKGGIRNKQ